MAKKIVVASGKGGVGKTTVTVNLGVALSSLGLRVALVDLDFGLNNLDVVMGVENRVVFDLLDVFEGRCRLKQALVQSNDRKNLFILPSGKIDFSKHITGQNVKLLIEKMNSVFDYVIIDAPAGIDLGFHRAVSCADEALVVVTPNLTSLRDADKVVSILQSYRLDKVSLVINRARGDLIVNKKMISPTDIELLLKTNLIAILPEEDAVFLSSGTLSKKCDSYRAYRTFALNLKNGTKKLFDTTCKYSGFFGSIRRSIKKSV
ncbi:MAG: septum site-determining protein MinD [Clostridia bacterium]|nr:septum site-determining protein MinD [Clostridia bacterium]